MRFIFDASKDGTQNIPLSTSPTKEFIQNYPPQVCPNLDESSAIEIIKPKRSYKVTNGLPKNIMSHT